MSSRRPERRKSGETGREDDVAVPTFSSRRPERRKSGETGCEDDVAVPTFSSRRPEGQKSGETGREDDVAVLTLSSRRPEGQKSDDRKGERKAAGRAKRWTIPEYRRPPAGKDLYPRSSRLIWYTQIPASTCWMAAITALWSGRP